MSSVSGPVILSIFTVRLRYRITIMLVATTNLGKPTEMLLNRIQILQDPNKQHNCSKDALFCKGRTNGPHLDRNHWLRDHGMEKSSQAERRGESQAEREAVSRCCLSVTPAARLRAATPHHAAAARAQQIAASTPATLPKTALSPSGRNAEGSNRLE